MIKKSPSISIFFPFLNDWGTVGSLVALSITTVEKLTDDWEVIIINDGSSANNREALEKIIKTINETKQQCSKVTKKKNRIRIINHEKNKGYGGALIRGFREAQKD